MNKYEMLDNVQDRITHYREISKPPVIVPSPRNIRLNIISIKIEENYTYTLEVLWGKPLKHDNTTEDYISSYIVEISKNGNNYSNRQEIEENSQRIARFENMMIGDYKARVAAVVATSDKMSSWEYSKTLFNHFPNNARLNYNNPDTYWWEL
jgi:hypothetical protein